MESHLAAPVGGLVEGSKLTFQVVVPSLNQGRFIGAARSSLPCESHDVDLEVVVVDSCSVDDTHSEVESSLTTEHSRKPSS